MKPVFAMMLPVEQDPSAWLIAGQSTLGYRPLREICVKHSALGPLCLETWMPEKQDDIPDNHPQLLRCREECKPRMPTRSLKNLYT
jgi:hypothetical protein